MYGRRPLRRPSPFELLRGADLDVEYHESDAPHSIDPAHIPAAVDWVATTLRSYA